LGGGTFEVISLRDYCRQANLTDLQFTLRRLMKIIEQMVRFSHPRQEFHLRTSYDQLLPVNLLIEPQTPPPTVTPQSVTPETVFGLALQPGDYVRVAGFAVTKTDPTRHLVTLNLPPTPTLAPAAY
jgi:hypothetical protein